MEEFYTQHRALLFTLAYQLTGSVEDAEDAVQEVFVKASDIDFERIEKPKAYLCKMVTNHCLNLLKSTQKQREVYYGPWLPEPIRTTDSDIIEVMVTRRELLSYAMLVLLERLTPTERAVFVLREALGFQYHEIAGMIDKSEPNCRKLMSRARSKVGITEEKPFVVEPVEVEWVSQLVSSLEHGDINQVLSLLANDVVLIADGGGKATAIPRPLENPDYVARFLVGGFKKMVGMLKGNYQFEFVPLNGNTSIVLRSGDEVLSVILIQLQNGKLSRIYFVRNPDKLTKI